MFTFQMAKKRMHMLASDLQFFVKKADDITVPVEIIFRDGRMLANHVPLFLEQSRLEFRGHRCNMICQSLCGEVEQLEDRLAGE